jgi:thioredoxin-dependent peroxiredoxin
MKRILVFALFCCGLAFALEVGSSPALPKSLTDSFGNTHTLQKNTWKVFFFYPRAASSGCTAQNIEYTKFYPDFIKVNTQVFGVSSDDAKSQCAFVANSKLKVPQIPNATDTLGKTFAVVPIFGMLSRDTFILSPDGEIAAIRRGVNAVSDAGEVLKFIQGKGNCKALTSGINQCKP